MTTPRMAIPSPNNFDEDWFEAWESMILQLDAHHFASFEDRGVFVALGGEWEFTSGSGVLTWGESLRIVTPSTGQPQDLEAGSVVILNGQFLWVTVSRGASEAVTLSASVSNTVPVSDASLPLAVRVGNQIYFRNGVILASEPFAVFEEPAPYGGPGGEQTLAQTLVIGNLTGGTDIEITPEDIIRVSDVEEAAHFVARPGVHPGTSQPWTSIIGAGNEVGDARESSVVGHNNSIVTNEDPFTGEYVAVFGNDNELDESDGDLFGTSIVGHYNSLSGGPAFIHGNGNDVVGSISPPIVMGENNDVSGYGPFVSGFSIVSTFSNYSAAFGRDHDVIGASFSVTAGIANVFQGFGSGDFRFETGYPQQMLARYDGGFSDYGKASASAALGESHWVHARHSLLAGNEGMGVVPSQFLIAAKRPLTTAFSEASFGDHQHTISVLAGISRGNETIELSNDGGNGVYWLRQEKTYAIDVKIVGRQILPGVSGPTYVDQGAPGESGVWSAACLIRTTQMKYARQTLTVSAAPSNGQTITIGGIVLTAAATRTPGNDDFATSGSTATIAASIRSALLDPDNSFLGAVVSGVNRSGSVLTVFAWDLGASGDSTTTVTDSGNLAWGSGTMADGEDLDVIVEWSSWTLDVGRDSLVSEHQAPDAGSVDFGATAAIGVDVAAGTFFVEVTGETGKAIKYTASVQATEIGNRPE